MATGECAEVRLRLHAESTRAEDGRLVVSDLTLAEADPVVLDRFVALLLEGIGEDDLLDEFLDEPPAVAAVILHLLHVAERAGAITYELTIGDAVMQLAAQRPPLAALTESTHRFDGFAALESSWLEPVDGAWLLLDPRSAFAARLPAPALAVLADLPISADGLAALDATERAALTLLARAGLVRGSALASASYWDPHDLRFHWRTRKGRHQRTIGATFPRRGSMPVREVIEPPVLAGVSVGPLHGPYLDAERRTDESSPYGQLLRRRHSVRRSDQELTETALAAFLNAHGLTVNIAQDDAAGIEYPQSRRLYPGGGATYEIDLNVSVLEPIGSITTGVWWWNPEDLRLHLRSDDADLVSRLYADARISTAGEGEPRALITYTVRIGRNSWKYEGMAYRLALLDVGVLYHHAYLIAADLDLGICGLGNGDGLLFDRGLGLDIEHETSIAELMIVGPA